ncbi:MAG: nucleoside deaminase [Anaerolineae bacterium]|jgi:tRNA(adenine34) deaminase|nr:nucleoside deaminase [Anaerolineae bacterium]MBT7070644.1 nucleoside deaminase [Anaerolineae bacterium]MBT7326272.1 nucleoside deaminase [Anaerolineae bacterium]
MPTDHDYMLHTVKLAKAAGEAGNLPIGALIALDGKIIAEGQNRLWAPVINPGRHAEIDALAGIKTSLWNRAKEMTLYTSLEPCLMCLSTILLHRIGHVIYGADDPRGGALCTVGHMPPAFERFYKELKMTGPALQEECDELFRQVVVKIESRIAK